ncbi:MAG: zinc-dependent metalloprotease [Candidatus Baltobacteraceae bacterium]
MTVVHRILRLLPAAVLAAGVLSAAPAVAAVAPAAPSPAADSGDGAAYAKVTHGAERAAGLFTLWRKDDHVLMEIGRDQLDKDYLEHAVPANGLGGFGFHSGDMFAQGARIVRFHLAGKHVVMIWPHERFLAKDGTPLATAVRESTADSVAALLPVIADNPSSGAELVDLTPLLGDMLDLGNQLSDAVDNPKSPQGGYRIDPTRSYFGPIKAFPKNVIVEADETFASAKPDAIDTVPDARFIQMRVKYNFTDVLSSPDYMPRLYDDRVGFWEDPHVQFADDTKRDNYLWYVLRWNVEPSDPSKALSPPKKPIVFYLDNSIPTEYRGPIREGILEWNKAFARLGVSNAVEVKDAPTDPSWDPDDIRYSVVRWVTDAQSEFGAEAQLVWDPRTGEIFRGGVLLDANLVRFAKFGERNIIAPLASPLANVDEIHPLMPSSSERPLHDERAFARGENAQAAFGATALTMMGDGMSLDTFARARLKAVVMHEVGHDFGLSHNFIGHNAYTAANLKSRSFTLANGTSSSVMDYWPINIWPKGVSQGTYYPTTIGPYDYHVIHWGYSRIPNATSPNAEVPTLSRWASAAVAPRYAFAGDEDGSFDGHAVDPRTAPFMATNRPIEWCATQLALTQRLMRGLDRQFPAPQQPWEDERSAFLSLFARYQTCASSMSHYIGAEYLTRGRVGDPGVTTPLRPVARAEELRAFGMIDRYLLSEGAWQLSPTTLRRLVYTEYMPFSNFGYDPAPRHDLPVVELIGAMQNQTLAYAFSPLVLQRLADLPTKTRAGQTMSLADLFGWTQHGVFADLAGKKPAGTQIHRNLQRRYARLLALMITAPVAGTPYDAQALARLELVDLRGTIARDVRRPGLDVQTRAHLEAMNVDVARALEARQVVPAGLGTTH